MFLTLQRVVEHLFQTNDFFNLTAKAMPDGGQLVIYITIGTNPQIVYADVDGDTNIIK